MNSIPIHTAHELNFSTEECHSAHTYGNIGVHVLATVSLIAFAEQTCGQLLMPFLEQDEISVGTIISVKHKAPASVGAIILCRATLIQHEEQKSLFSVALYHKERLLMEGTHGRFVCRYDDLSTL